MAYSQLDVAAITDIPALIGSFAEDNGWTVTGTSPVPILQRADDDTALSFQVAASIAGANHQIAVSAVAAPSVTSLARTFSPTLNGTNSVPIVSLPTKLHLIGGASPEPFIGAVIEYGFNFYRHLYIGNMEKIGAYTGGEVIAATRFVDLAGNGGAKNLTYNDGGVVKYIGSSFGSVEAIGNSGGVNVVHGDNPVPWRSFFSSRAGTPLPSLPGTMACGGFCDDINDGYLAQSLSPFAGQNQLVPINLYAVAPITGDSRFVPLGRMAGIRMVHMQNLDPAVAITVGDKTWHCFPAIRKNSLTVVTTPPTAWNGDETSYYVGYAYLDEA